MEHTKATKRVPASSRKRKSNAKKIPSQQTKGEQRWKKSRTIERQPSLDISVLPSIENIRDFPMTQPSAETSMGKVLEDSLTSKPQAGSHQTAHDAGQCNEDPAFPNGQPSIFFDPVNPTISVFQHSANDPSLSASNMNRGPGIRIPRLKTPPPEKRWPPQKRENWHQSATDSQYPRQGVPAKLKVPKPVPKVTYPELLDIRAGSRKGNGNANVKASGKSDVAREEESAQGLLRTYSQVTHEIDNLPLKTLPQQPPLNEQVKLPGSGPVSKNVADISGGTHDTDDTDIVKKQTGDGSTPQGLKNIPSLHRTGSSSKSAQVQRTFPDTGPVQYTQGYVKIERPHKKGLGVKYLLHVDVPIRTSGRREVANPTIVGRLPEKRDNFAQSPKEAGQIGERQANVDDVRADTAAMNGICSNLPQQGSVGSKKPSAQKGKSPRRISDVAFGSSIGSTQVPSSTGKQNISHVKSSACQRMSDQNMSSTCRDSRVSRQLFPKGKDGGLDVDPSQDSTKAVQLPLYASSVGASSFGIVGKPSENTIPAKISIADLINWDNDVCLPGSDLLTKDEEEAVESLCRDVPDLVCGEVPDFDSLPQDFIDPQNIDWMKTDGTDAIPLETPSTGTAELAWTSGQEQIQAQGHQLCPGLIETNEGNDTGVFLQSFVGRNSMQTAPSPVNIASRITRVSSSGIANQISYKLKCAQCPFVCSTPRTLEVHVATSHRPSLSSVCIYCMRCFSCICDPSERQKHKRSCQRHIALKACFHCRHMFPNDEILSDHILERHPFMSIPCSLYKKRVMSHTETSQGSNAGDKKKCAFKCSICHCLYGTKSGYQRHLMKEHSDAILLGGFNDR